MLITRLAKILMCLALAGFCLLVAYDNIADYGPNYVFVQHVLSMDTTFPGNSCCTGQSPIRSCGRSPMR